ncbi:MAG: sigma-70 family RNA polymerase sigma factor [Defluviitaleaceae bacterium]|nr:sigma-70 family RNA polymerase sigma factor [Defluviitaleaceae bacterium]
MLLFELLQHVFTIAHINSGSFPKPLSATEEAECLRKYHESPEPERTRAKNTLIEHNLRLVAHIVRKFNLPLETEDLISVGSIGLIKGITSFDPDKKVREKKVRLATYVSRCIENEILMYLRARKKLAGEVPIERPFNNDNEGNPISYLDVLESDEAWDFSEQIFIKERAKLLAGILRKLKPRARRIIELRYGLGNHEETTQLKIGDILDISRSYVSRLEKRTLDELRAQIEAIEAERDPEEE